MGERGLGTLVWRKKTPVKGETKEKVWYGIPEVRLSWVVNVWCVYV